MSDIQTQIYSSYKRKRNRDYMITLITAQALQNKLSKKNKTI